MHLCLSYKVFRWHPLDIILYSASYVVGTLSYVVSNLCALSIASLFLALADIKAFSHMYM